MKQELDTSPDTIASHGLENRRVALVTGGAMGIGAAMGLAALL